MKSGLHLLNDDNFSLQLVTGDASEAHQEFQGVFLGSLSLQILNKNH